MPLPASILSLGAPSNASREVMAALRAEKARQAALVEEREIQRLRKLADYIEAHPETLHQAGEYVRRFLDSPQHTALLWALGEWDQILQTWTPARIAEMLRGDSEDQRHLRETAPFFRPQEARMATA